MPALRSVSLIVQTRHLSDGDLAAYLDGIVPWAERQRIEAHLVHCAACLDEVVRLLCIIRPDDPSAPPPA
jgi:anti-sigma factor RsiW